MGNKMRAGIIGCGMIAKRLHVPDYSYAPDTDLVAFCDLVPEKARELAAKWFPQAAIYSDYKKMLREQNLDCVTVTLPNYLHAAVAVDCLRAGVNVLVEKPMATSTEEGRRMIEAAKKAGKLLMVNQSQRLFPPHVKAKEILDSGIMGKILFVSATFGHEGPEYWSPTGKWFFQKDKARWGAMADLGVHKADLIRHLTGKEISEISAYTARLEKKGTVEDNFVSCLKFEDGTVGTLCASWTVKGMEANYTILHCENGTLRVAEIPGEPLLAQMVKPQCEIKFEVPPALTNVAESWGLDVSGRFVRACRGEEKPYCTGEDALKSLEVILAAEKSVDTGRSVKVKH
jgi:UDP-N-acetylglucosamine 3-dehydrogenase